VRSEREPLPPVAGDERLQAVACAHHEEARAGGGIRFPDDDGAAGLQRCRGAPEQGLLV
jgi:hypothetical protein